MNLGIAVIAPREMKYRYGSKILEAGQGLGEYYFTGWRSENGGFHRVSSPALPVRRTLEEARADLDAWAKKKKLEVTR